MNITVMKMRNLKKLRKEIKNNKNCELIWILEHDDLYTAGTSYKEEEIIDKNIKGYAAKTENLYGSGGMKTKFT